MSLPRFAAFTALCTVPLLALPAEAQTLLDLLFKPQRQAVVEPPAAAPAPKPKPKPARVEPPAYRDYVADKLVRFSPGEVIGASPVSVGTLGGFSLAEGLAVAGPLSVMTEKPVAEALKTHYAAVPAFLWVSGFDPSANARDVLAHLADAATYGLEPANYFVQPPAAKWTVDAMAARMAELARFEFALSAAVLRYVRDVEGGRIDPNRMSTYYDIKSKVPALAPVLASLAASGNPAGDLAALHPREPEYTALRRELARLGDATGQTVTIAPGTLIKPGMQHPELPKVLAAMRATSDDALLTDHAITFAIYDDGGAYDEGLVAFVKAWQATKGLQADGVIGARSIAAAIDVSDAVKRSRVILALEQMRWFPDAYGGRYVFINQPAFTATYFNNDIPELVSRTVIGTPKNQTSVFQDVIEYVEFNPTWGVPQSIIVNEFLPKLRGNPGYLDAQGYEVYNAKGQRIPSSAVNWSAVGRNVPVSVIQPGGDGNALGDLKIMFPNSHSIYMHDTPARKLFERDVRAFSHGCVRLQKPHEMAAKVLGVTLADVEGRLAQPTNRMTVKQRLPVYLGYFTAWPDESGAVNYFEDIYGRDARLQKAIEKTRAQRATSA